MSAVQYHTSRYFEADLPDPPEMLSATAGPSLPSRRAKSQDDRSYTKTPSNNRHGLPNSLGYIYIYILSPYA